MTNIIFYREIQDNCKIWDEILSNYPYIQSIDLSDNQLNQMPFDMSAFTKLKSLDIRSNPFSNVNLYQLYL